ncbi:MAG: DUF4760 domain-containing protein [Erysipelotrichaceae bacterium]|nr:DUF4760 domain-containing protein [Erysipelotrichaceae bacterium]
MEIFEILLSAANLIAIIVGFYFTAKELKESREQREQERKSIRLEHSIDCSKDFASLINDELSFINNCLCNQEYEKVINTFKYEDLKLFDKREYLRLIENNKEMEKYLAYFTDYDLVESYYSYIVDAYIENVDLTPEEFTKIQTLISCKWQLTKQEAEFLDTNKLNQIDDKEERNKYLHYNQKARDIIYYKRKIKSYYYEKLIGMLNKLEYFSMTFNTNLADEEVVYPSLHQSFLKTVKYLYPHICYLNSGETSDKYYTHIIELYNLWKDRYVEDVKTNMEKEESLRNKTVNTKSKF